MERVRRGTTVEEGCGWAGKPLKGMAYSKPRQRAGQNPAPFRIFLRDGQME